MALSKRYGGGFVGQYMGDDMVVRDRVWLVEIWTEGGERGERESEEAGELAFPAQEPLVVEWSDFSHTEVIQGSMATLRVISPFDRAFAHLYAAKDAEVQLRVYCDGALWWTGNLDPEMYCEPYERADGYEVSLTFSDFGALRRMRYIAPDRAYLQSPDSVMAECKKRLCMSHVAHYLDCSTAYNGTPISKLDSLMMSTDNWTDETGESSTLHTVLSAMLMPLGLHMVQRAGDIRIYDINDLCVSYGGAACGVWWSDIRQTLDTAPVANRISVNFSTYATAEIADGTIDAEKLFRFGGNWVRIPYDTNKDDAATDGFELACGSAATENRQLDVYGGSVFRIRPLYSGDSCAGVLWRAIRHDRDGNDTTLVGGGLSDPYASGFTCGGTSAVMSLTSDIVIPKAGTREYMLRLKCDLLFDVRTNPFGATDDVYNDKGAWERLQNWANYAYIPVKIELIDENGIAKYHYTNRNRCATPGVGGVAGWSGGAAGWGDAWFCYYDLNNRKSKSGLGGWAANRQCIGETRSDLPALWSRRGDGEFVPMPPERGRIRLTIGAGVHHHDYNHAVRSELNDEVRWIGYKSPSITVVRADGGTIDTEDISYRGVAVETAAEDVSIDTLAGTVIEDAAAPCARGALLDGNGVPVGRHFSRGGVTGYLEQLLLGTLFSAYGDRHTMLSGEARLESGQPLVRSDANQPAGTLFIMAGEVADCIQGTSELKLLEIRPDEWVDNTME